MTRREFLAAAGTSGAAAIGKRRAVDARLSNPGARASDLGADRAYWLTVLRRISDPVLRNMAVGGLKARMPVEQAAGADRRAVTHLEAIGRLLAGIAPWLELGDEGAAEASERREYAALAQSAISHGVDPASPDYLNFTRDSQPLVDAAFLAQALLRAPRTLCATLPAAPKRQLIAALESTRAITPGFNNWLLFPAAIEAALLRLGASWDRVRVDYAVRQHDTWYKGDGAYGDGPDFHWDYYNSFVIHPMLVDVLEACGDERPAWKELRARVQQRARRYAAVQERFIGPDGSYPAVGRSLAYRCGAFHLLAQSALRRTLPDGVSAAQVRGALTAAIRRSIEAPGTFDADGWLRIGFCGHQPGIGEPYISTGSLYLCSAALLPLGLAPGDDFWSSPPQAWTSARAWAGQPFPIDHALAT
jgi:hypothetical protein